jgi:hypothetical protein
MGTEELQKTIFNGFLKIKEMEGVPQDDAEAVKWFRHDNGQLEQRENFIDGEREGLWEAAVDQSPLMQPQQIFTADQRGVILGCL